MKKLFLLCALMCAASLIGMEKEIEKGNLGAFGQLPKELRQEIAQTAIQASTSIDEAIKAIQNASLVYGGVQLDKTGAMEILKNALPKDLTALNAVRHLQGNNLKDFTKLVHMLTDHLENAQTSYIAEFYKKEPFSQEYLKLGKDLQEIAGDETESAQNKIIELINKGADIHFTYGGSILEEAIICLNPERVKFLLQLGVKPTDSDLRAAEFVTTNSSNPMDLEKALTIKNLIEKAAMKNNEEVQ